ncbi:N-acetylmuramoyl-L-alanine amidase [Fictibacillus gelatini]|uniref:N-acetylmuramoyl-L-alanine amidase n=1 Tax=Fictibacillus gelatini TaxID=225985 RepID=UPI000422A061|nr:N-acetylmuramoyl-L-alanine amidase [Fictibacillus gelatini]
MKKLVIDPGHGGKDPGSGYKEIQEQDINLAISLKVKKELETNYNVEIYMTRKDEKTVSLDERTNMANKIKADYYCSIHQNAGGGEGFESYIFDGNVSSQTVKMRDVLHASIKKVMDKYGVMNRGKKRANFHVLRETEMPAVLLEVLFIDSEKDVKLLKNPTFLNEVSAAIADGIADAMDLPRKPKDHPSKKFTILGDSVLTAAEMDRFIKKINPEAPSIAGDYINFGKDYGVRGDVAFAQAIHETNYFRFTGAIKPEQNNFAGLGATGKNRAASFKNPRDGVLAHIQHLYAYASTRELPKSHPLIDPRFQYVKRGEAPTWIDLNGKWAIPGEHYGQLVLALYKNMIESVLNPLEAKVKILQSQLKELDI